MKFLPIDFILLMLGICGRLARGFRMTAPSSMRSMGNIQFTQVKDRDSKKVKHKRQRAGENDKYSKRNIPSNLSMSSYSDGSDDTSSSSSFTSSSTKNQSPESGNKQGIYRPMKVMVFIDGTWLFYSLILGRETTCPVQRKLGKKWDKTHRVDYLKLQQLIGANVNSQLLTQNNVDRLVDVVRSVVFTSTRLDTPADSLRANMITDFQSANFEVHRLTTSGQQEKCVDISLAVEMLYLATVPDAYDVAVIITGDKDFMPAMQKTRLTGKRVLLCTMRNSCNREMLRPEQHIRDFDVLYLDDYIDELVVPKLSADGADLQGKLNDMILKILQRSSSCITSRQLGKVLQSIPLDGNDALYKLKQRFGSLRTYLEKQSGLLELSFPEDISPDFIVSIKEERDGDEDEEEREEGEEEEGEEEEGFLFEGEGGEKGGGEREDSDRNQSVKEFEIYDTDDVYEIDLEKDSIKETIEEIAGLEEESEEDYKTSLQLLTVINLKSMLKDKGLIVAGTKPDLIDRLNYFREGRRARLTYSSPVIKAPMKNPMESATESEVGQNVDEFSKFNVETVRKVSAVGIESASTISASNSVSAVASQAAAEDDAWTLEKIVSLIEDSDTQSLSSRDIGRYLQSLSSVGGGNALTRLKNEHESLKQFLYTYARGRLEMDLVVNDSKAKKEFIVYLATNDKKRVARPVPVKRDLKYLKNNNIDRRALSEREEAAIYNRETDEENDSYLKMSKQRSK